MESRLNVKPGAKGARRSGPFESGVTEMSSAKPKSDTVILVDDSVGVSEAVSLLLKTVNLETQMFSNPLAFMDASIEHAGCIILDVRMPEMSGLEVFRKLVERGVDIPVIFMTGHGDVAMAVRAMRAGAFDFLEKPVDDQVLIDSVLEAISVDTERRARVQRQLASRSLIDRLTPRELEIARLLVEGETSRSIAEKLGLSVRTVEGYRSRLMVKLEITSLAKLVELLRH
jgi:FixJ family two-component response regulator